jgi:hypothetical protein
MNDLSSLIASLALASVAAVGVWLVWVGVVGLFTKPKAALAVGLARPVTYPVSDLPAGIQRVTGGVLHVLGQRLLASQDGAKINGRLKRTGWVYQSIGDYQASKVANALIYAMGGAFAGNVLLGGSAAVVLGAIGFGFLGFQRPDERIHDILKKRRDSLRREMAWTLDRLAAVMQTGEALGPSLGRLTDQNYDWVAGSGGGLFIAVLRDISAGLASGRNDISALLDEIRATLPEDIAELDEFLQVVRANLEKRQPVVEQLRALSITMRDDLNNRIEELAQKSELKIVLITSAVIMPLLLIVVGGVLLANLNQVLGR